jgi:hypothetical protein
MVEFHEDYISKLDLDIQFQRKMSVRALPGSRPLEFIGQDECVFFQYLVSNKNWVGPKGERPLLPKNDGDGKMLSAFQSRLTGFGREMSEEDLNRVNEKRQGCTYLDVEAAREVLKTTSKLPLTESPFVRKILIGINNEGYWNSQHMAVQLEDVVDCLKILYPDFDFVFLFDHSQGHSRKREGALDVQCMNVSFGGKQSRLRDTQIETEKHFLGPNDPILHVGDIQKMNWAADVPEGNDDGPFNLNTEEKQKRRKVQLLDIYVDNKKKTKKELEIDLRREGILDPDKQRRGYNQKDLQEMAVKHGISVTKREQKELTGWLGQPKGLLQVARERGLIDHQNHHTYTANPKKNPDGTENEAKSLRRILGQCKDFRTELTHLQVLAKELQVQVLFTPKFHAEMAGEGIEYSWGHSKGLYRRKPLQRKRKRASFEALVDECTDVHTVMTHERVRKFSARARAYLCTYHYLATTNNNKQQTDHTGDQKQRGKKDDNDADEKKPLMLGEIERLMKKFKSHRCAFDFDRGFLMDIA